MVRTGVSAVLCVLAVLLASAWGQIQVHQSGNYTFAGNLTAGNNNVTIVFPTCHNETNIVVAVVYKNNVDYVRNIEPWGLFYEVKQYGNFVWHLASLNSCTNDTCNLQCSESTCSCKPGFKGTFCCEKIITPSDTPSCTDSTCKNNGTCIDLLDGYSCSCATGYVGQNCTIVDTCVDDPCANNGTCNVDNGGYNCTCKPGYKGTNCTEIDLCYPDPCQHNGKCTSTSTDYTCECLSGMYGKNCSIVCNCTNGECVPVGNPATGFTCSCFNGFDGPTCCESVPNHCLGSPCLNNATCKSNATAYTCNCLPGYMGYNCSTYNFCANKTCLYGGQCENLKTKAECSCLEGFIGDTCATVCDCVHGDCVPNPTGDNFTCNCHPGYTGPTCCQNTTGPCTNETCAHGLCHDINQTEYFCNCSTGYTGKNCAIDIDDCNPNRCMHNSTCQDKVADYMCNCTAGYTGKNCSIDIDECAHNPCVHGSCSDLVADYKCTCMDGYEGKNCSENIDDCNPNRCMHNSTCQDKVADYMCNCTAGYKGKNCSIDIDECAHNPCVHGSCSDLVADYKCTCMDGYEGKNCSENIDDCNPNRCMHNSTCQDKVADYMCTCTAGYKGKNCSIDIDECAHNPCVHGDCSDLVADYKCTCMDGYEGKNCSENIDDCNPNRCMLNSTCQDKVADYMCKCTAGYTGKNCSIDIDECVPNHCVNGTCHDRVDDYFCECTVGYEGKNCSEDTNECQRNSSLCQNGGLCINTAGSYHCNCISGYTGLDCSIPPRCANNTCHEFATCSEASTDRGYSCVCFTGWIGDGFNCSAYCEAGQVTLENGKVFSFSKSILNEVVASNETCLDGRSIAQTTCKFSSTGGRANFDTVHLQYLPCNITLATEFGTDKNWTAPVNMTVMDIEENAVKLGILTTSSNISADVAEQATNILSSLSKSLVNLPEDSSTGTEEVVTREVVESVLQVGNNVMNTWKAKGHVNVTGTDDQPLSDEENMEYAAEKTEELIVAVEVFLERMETPDYSTITIQTTSIDAEVVRPPVFLTDDPTPSLIFQPPLRFQGNSGDAELDNSVEVPGELLEYASNNLESNRKKRAIIVRRRLRVVFTSFRNDVLFPSPTPVARVTRVQIKDFKQDVSTQPSIPPITIKYNTIRVKHGDIVQTNTTKRIRTELQCSEYNRPKTKWVPGKCVLVAGTYPPRCHCRRVTTFACLIKHVEFGSQEALSLVSKIGCGLSIVGVVATFLIYITIKSLRDRKPSLYLLNICVCLFIIYVTFLVGVPAIETKTGCDVATIFLQFSLLAFWFWTGANAYNLYNMLVNVFGGGDDLATCKVVTVCYISPMIIVAANVIATIFTTDLSKDLSDPDFISGYRLNNMCWLREYSLYFGFILPMGLILLACIIIFIVVMIKLTVKRKKVQSTAKENGVRQGLLFAVVLCSSMGLAWVFGILMLASDNPKYVEVMSWLFTIFNASQGITIFYLNCLRQKAVRKMWFTPIIGKYFGRVASVKPSSTTSQDSTKGKTYSTTDSTAKSTIFNTSNSHSTSTPAF
uniref:neurogenic locus notch homolog protein 1-like isoform X3 n=1 Tax=Ciona intestinalis TaxID=7719 RepID=UPI000EF4CB94|nr:neurogenic locus notch homolog protein 1-like isoform X3 [Ciona intestinalis]|eukprot:XP_026691117.1 neurogenic locus notch homolog protein 1-like isoform X3 [Ciona intestinalis]